MKAYIVIPVHKFLPSFGDPVDKGTTKVGALSSYNSGYPIIYFSLEEAEEAMSRMHVSEKFDRAIIELGEVVKMKEYGK